MNVKKIILIIVLTILMLFSLTFSSFATEIEDSVTDIPDTSIDDNLDNSEDGNEGSNEDTDTDIGNDNGEDASTGTDNGNNVGNDNTSNQNPGNDTPSGSYEKTPNQSENEYESPVVDTPIQTERPTENKPTYNNTVTEDLSDNVNLRDLILDIEGLSPEFDKDIIEYYLIVDLSVESVNIEAYPEDENSIVMIDGNVDLQEGENTISITVKAEAGNTKTYTIYVTKTDDIDMVNANLKNLSVKGFNFYPSFKNNIYNYNLTINEKLSQLEITVEPEIEGATYEIIGNENLVEGDNLIKIIVTAKDGTAKREYKLNVFISSKNVEIQETSKTPAIVLLSVLCIAIIGTAIAISKKY